MNEAVFAPVRVPAGPTRRPPHLLRRRLEPSSCV